ncbi:MAG: hypothetical protein HQL96_08955, partial [Magnetococcales bacterium]|nr:hypothetical protein [Magnetococcales bacterium]
MKTSTFGLPLLFIELLAGALFLVLILLTASRFGDLLVSRTRQAGPESARIERLQALNTELTALLNLTRTQLQGLRGEKPPKERPGDEREAGLAHIERLDMEIERLEKSGRGLPEARKALAALTEEKRQLVER